VGHDKHDDIPADHAGARFITGLKDVHAVSTWLGKNGWTVVTAELGYLAKNYPELDEAARIEVGEFLHELDDHDDVQRVWAAFK
jgi:transcriptional/translational regulatory protein YebC/TACO1